MSIELGQAYVQIVPSAKGIKNKLSETLGSEVAAAGKESGEKAGVNIVGMIKNAIIAGGIATAFKMAIDEGGALQQSLGGIETLFKDNANKVKEYAKQAYETTGLSANEYMESVTGFSASLLQGLKGDTSKAAEISNMAMIDMADNSNKMGTSMESIKTAYAGFAKQNYTMLDNLKLGYGGTKTEMQRLLKDAQKISKVKYDINNLADVYSAIHVIQTELDITGTTAKEASSTIAGSGNAVKAAFKNVLGNLALGQDVGESLKALVKTTTTFLIGNLLPAVWNIVKSLPEAMIALVQETLSQVVSIGPKFMESLSAGLMSGAPKMYESIMLSIGNLQVFIKEQLPQLLERGREFIVSMANGIFSAMPEVISSVGNIIVSIVSALGDALPILGEEGFKLLAGLAKGFIENYPEMAKSAYEVISNLLATIGEKLPSILQKGIEILGQLAAGVVTGIPELLAKVPGIFNGMVSEFSKHDWGSIGSNIIDGLITGLRNGLGKVWDAAKEVAKSALDAAKSFLDIHSPSRKFGWIGEMSIEGLVKSLLKNLDTVRSAAKLVSESLYDNIENKLSKSALSYSGSINVLRAKSDTDKGFNQTINIYSPEALSPAESARHVKNATRQMALDIALAN